MTREIIKKKFTTWSILLAATTTMGLLTACEQVQNIVDRQNEELEQNIAEKEKAFAPLAGTYRGTITNPGSEPRPVSLVLIPTTIIVQNPGRNDISQVPSLGGTLSVVLSSSTEEKEENLVPIAHYDSALWNPETGKLRLNGVFHTASAGEIRVYLDSLVDGDHIVARAHSSLKGFVGTIDVVRLPDTAL